MNVNDRVLIVGPPSLYNLVDIDVLKENGLYPFFTYLKQHKNTIKNYAIFIDSLSYQEILAIVEKERIKFLVCFNDNFLIESAKVRETAKLPGIKTKEIGKYKIKSEMYQAVSKTVKTIPHVKLDQDLKYQDVIKIFGKNKLFIKPDSMAGSEGTSMCQNEKEFNSIQEKILSNKYSSIIQPYLDEKLFHCELYVKDGKVIYQDARKYSYPNQKILSGKIISSFPIIDKAKRMVLEEHACRVKDALNFKCGVMHTEFFWDEINAPVFLETNIRQAGGGINLIHREITGISMETVMILLETGRDIQISTNQEFYYTSGYIPWKSGVVKSFNIPKLKGTLKFDFRVNIGDVLASNTSASDTAVSYLGKYNKHEDIQSDFETIEKSDIVLYI